MSEKSLGMKNKEKYLSEGKKIPKCVNKGCDNSCCFHDFIIDTNGLAQCRLFSGKDHFGRITASIT